MRYNLQIIKTSDFVKLDAKGRLDVNQSHDVLAGLAKTCLTIRASAEARRQRLRNAQDQIVTASGDAKDAYVPFMKDLQDIKKYLAGDLSKSSIADLGDAANKVQTDGGTVKDKIGVIITTLDSVQGN
jgi:hypothetical protein